MSKISLIAHIADIHIRKSPTRNEEYQQVFDNLLKSLEEKKPDRITIVGDIVHENLNLQPEQIIITHGFLDALSKIAPVRITRGNHDMQKSNNNRTDSVEAIVKTLNNPNVIYYNKTGFYIDENIIWAVWHHGDKNNDPWKSKEGKKILAYDSQSGYATIDLFHDPIGGCRSTTGFEMKSQSYYKVSDFKGNFLMAGDIHLQQYLDKNKTKAYSGSLISQDFSEGNSSFHGYLLWNIQNKTVDEISIHNDYSFKNIRITPYTDFEELDFEINNPTEHMKIRFIWGTLPQTRTKDNERKLITYVKSKHSDVIISHKNQFIENEKIDVNENITIDNIVDKSVQHEIFKEYLSKIGTSEDIVNNIIALDEEILNEIEIEDNVSVEWNVVKFGGKNFMSYEKFDIDWRDQDGLYQISGINTAGKCVDPETEIEIEFNEDFIINKLGFLPKELL